MLAAFLVRMISSALQSTAWHKLFCTGNCWVQPRHAHDDPSLAWAQTPSAMMQTLYKVAAVACASWVKELESYLAKWGVHELIVPSVGSSLP